MPFDPQEFFFGELRTSRDLLDREVHYLAYHYHWSEQEIMAMPRDKRRRYIVVLADELEKLTMEPEQSPTPNNDADSILRDAATPCTRSAVRVLLGMPDAEGRTSPSLAWYPGPDSSITCTH